MMDRVAWLWRTLSSVYRSWRGPLVVLAGAALVALPWALVGRPWRALVASLLIMAAWSAVVVLLGVEIARQDRLRRQQSGGSSSPRMAGSAVRRALPASRLHADVTVLVPVKDAAHELEAVLRALQAQTWPSFVCAIVDTGSTDHTLDVAFELTADDDRFRVFAPEPSVARDDLTGWLASAPKRLVRVAPACSLPRTWLDDELARSSVPPPEDLAGGPYVELREPVVAPFRADRIPPGSIVLMPEAAYHVDELGPLANVLERRGHHVVFLVSDRRLTYVTAALRHQPQRVLRYPKAEVPADEVAVAAGAVVVMNDWGEASTIVEAANRNTVPTFGKVEGVQDFEDVDAPVTRRPYRRVQHVLAQGANDAAAVGEDRATIVGNSRLERLWLAEQPKGPREDLVIVNVNFTYDVLPGVRERWLETAVAGCQRVQCPYVISLHPSEEPSLADPHVAHEPMRHLLTRASALISRFSTVAFEAMARGVPFIYHNPHGERVPTFQEPDGAFPISHTLDELEEALEVVNRWRDGYRERCAPFFRAQVDVDPDRSAEERTAEVILQAL